MRTIVWPALVATLLSACKGDRGNQVAPAPSHGVAALPTQSASPLEPSAAPPAPSTDVGSRILPFAKACRAIEVKGRIVDESGQVVRLSDALDRSPWLDLDAGARLTVKHTETAREVSLSGPGRLRPCVQGEERFEIVRGGVRTVLAAGARPGAEVLIATPFGVVRYGDARLEIKVGAHDLSIVAEAGDGWLESPSPSDGIVEERISTGKRLERKGLTVDVKGLLSGCEVAAEATEARARTLLSPGPSDRATPLGARAAEHMRARRNARFACAVAGAALGTLEIGGDCDALREALGRAEARFRGVPSAASKAEKTESR